jgi:peptidyl-dipeptidase Dcp
VFYNLAGADSTEAREALMRELGAEDERVFVEVTNNKALWAKIEALWQGRDALDLTPEQARVLELYRQMFVRSGARRWRGRRRSG